MSAEATPAIGDLARDYTIAVNEKREIDEARNRGQATAADVTQARDRVAAARRACDAAMEPMSAPAHVQGALIHAEEIR